MASELWENPRRSLTIARLDLDVGSDSRRSTQQKQRRKRRELTRHNINELPTISAHAVVALAPVLDDRAGLCRAVVRRVVMLGTVRKKSVPKR